MSGTFGEGGATTHPITPADLGSFFFRREYGVFADVWLCAPKAFPLAGSALPHCVACSGSPETAIPRIRMEGFSTISILAVSPPGFAFLQKCCDAFFEIGGLADASIALHRLFYLTVQLLASIAGKQLLGCLQ